MMSGINAGVMLFNPDRAVYQRMLSEIKDHRHPEHLDCYGPEQEYMKHMQRPTLALGFSCAFLRTVATVSQNHGISNRNDFDHICMRGYDIWRLDFL